jgi:UDP-glucose 4-epimerase
VEPINSVRDYLHLDDLATAFDEVLEDRPRPGSCEIYNVGSGIGHSIGDVIAIIEAVTSRPLAWRSVAPPGRRATWNVLDSGRFCTRFGWTPRIPFEAGVRRLWADLSGPVSGGGA